MKPHSGNGVRPGEVSLAHHGVLFLDELAEFPRSVLDALRQPLETGCITVARGGRRADYPAAFQLIAAMNPCPCGHLGDGSRCDCGVETVRRYRSRVSGPLLDRFDLMVELARPSSNGVMSAVPESSAAIAARVRSAAQRQQRRQGCRNARLPPAALKSAQLSAAAVGALDEAVTRYQLSRRGIDRVLRVARTIADIAQRDDIPREALSEALSFRAGNGGNVLSPGGP